MGSVKNTNGWKDIKHFKPSDLACKCDGLCQPKVMNVSMDFVRKLDALRDKLKQPFKINSGCRCERFNQGVIRGDPGSPHVSGPDGQSCAVDVFVPNGQYRADLLTAAFAIGFSGVGIGRTWIHLDDLPRGEHVVWIYPPSKKG